MYEDIDVELMCQSVYAHEILTDISKLPYREVIVSPVMPKSARTVLNRAGRKRERKNNCEQV